MKYLLDSNVCIHFLNGKFELDKKIASVGIENCFISELTILELLYGVANGNSSRKEQNLQKLRGFERSFMSQTLPISPAFEAFAEQKTRLRKLGTLISDFDLLIGCTALVHNFTLVSDNVREMSRIEKLRLENWIAP
jgi:tRNA(fMet)-specific endonuclease VapC